MPRILYVLSVCNLIIGTGAFCLTGILQPVAESLGVSVAATGQSMTAYAIATAVLAPLLLIFTGSWSRRRALQGALALFATGLLVCATATGLTQLLLGRVLMGAGGMFTPLAASIAVASVVPARQGKALSLTFLGMSLSYVIGLPLGAWLGLTAGWRVPLLALAAVAIIMLLVLGAMVPRTLANPGVRLTGLGAVLRRPEVVRALALTLLYFSAIFTVFSYTGPVLQTLNPMSAATLSGTLVMFGIAGVVGTLLGGWAGDRFGALVTLRLQLAVLIAMMLLVPLTKGHYVLMVLVFAVWGTAGFGMMSPTQTRLAGFSPDKAPILLSLNTSMLYFGTALGAAAAGGASAKIGFGALAWVGVVFAVLGALALLPVRNRPRTAAAKP